MSHASRNEPARRAARNICGSGKHCYTNRAQAQTQGARSAKLQGQPLYVYKCPTCRYWHISRQSHEGSRKGGYG